MSAFYQREHVMFEPYLEQWDLTVDGEPFVSRNANLLPVRRHGQPAMLKVACSAEERAGNLLMAWWDASGAAPVLGCDGDALLMTRALGPGSLRQWVASGHDRDATEILCDVVAYLHAPRVQAAPAVIPLMQWFAPLCNGAQHPPGLLGHCARTARHLLATPRDVVILHGDIHHDNVLDFGSLGWLAIDPKGLCGERGFDYANLFCNPDDAVGLIPEGLTRRMDIVTASSGIEAQRMLQWVLAWAGLSATWMLEDGEDPHDRLDVARWAVSMLGESL